MGKQQDREKIVQEIKVAADLYRKLPFCKIPEELKKIEAFIKYTCYNRIN